MTAPADDEMTELVDANFPTMALVGKGANGVPRFLIAKQDGAAGLMDPGFVRDLIAKAEPEPAGRERVEMANGITVSGSAADIASFIHAAAQRVAKAEQSTATQNDLPDSDFAYIEDGGKKDESGKTTPRSLRHFPINDAAHVRNALARASSSPFGDKAMPKIRAAAKKFGIEVSKESGVPDTITKADGPEVDEGIDGLDPTVPLAAPDMAAPGDPAGPGSPAWEAIDAATACKWTSILSRAKAAVGLLAEREMIEAVSADPSDAEHACDLQDVCCAIDCAISILAPFAVAEQAEADAGMEAVGKAMAGFDPGPLEQAEAFAAIAKAGRPLNPENVAGARHAAASLLAALSSLPAAPAADEPITKEAAVAADQTPTEPAVASATVTSTSGATVTYVSGVPAGGTVVTTPAPVAKAEDTSPQETPAAPAAEPAPAEPGPVAKADGEAPCVVYDAKGQPLGIVAMDAITAVQGAAPAAPAAAMDSDGPAPDSDAEPADDGMGADDAAPCPDPGDMTPQPAAEAGTPADEAEDVAKQDQAATDGGQDGTITISKGELESTITKAVAAALGALSPAQDIAKQADVAGLGEEVETLKARLAAVEEQPAVPKVFTNGAVPPPGQMRGQDRAPQGGPVVDVAKAAQLKGTLYRGTAPEQNDAARAMQEMAIAQLSAIHSGGGAPA